MTKDQEDKLDSIHDELISMRGNFKMIDQHLEQHRESIIAEVKRGIERDVIIKTLENDRSKFLGALWVTTSGFLLGIISFIISLFKHN